MTRFDAQRLRAMIETHLDKTGSNRAREILTDWKNMVAKFIKVMPVDYRRALEDIKKKAA